MYPDDTLLRRALFSNALFSAGSAVTLALAARPLADFLGSVDPITLYAVAGALLLFSVDLVHQTRAERVHPLRAFGATLADLAWVAGSAVLLLLRPELFSSGGKILVAGVAAAVLLLALAQLMGLKRYARNRDGRTAAPHAYTLTKTLEAPADRVWELLKRLDRIDEFYELLRSVEVRNTEDGIVRTCTADGGQRWSEEVLEMDDDDRALTLRFVTEADDFPFPMTEMVGGWRIDPRDGHCDVTLWYEYALKGGPFDAFTAALIGPALEKRMDPVLEKLGAVAGVPDADPSARSARLSP